MNNPVKFIEIPSVDFARAAKFYEAVLGIKLTVCDSCDMEKIAFFGDFSAEPNVAISWAADFCSSKDGVLVRLNVENIESTLALIAANGGKSVREKTKNEMDGMGYFANFRTARATRLDFMQKSKGGESKF